MQYLVAVSIEHEGLVALYAVRGAGTQEQAEKAVQETETMALTYKGSVFTLATAQSIKPVEGAGMCEINILDLRKR